MSRGWLTSRRQNEVYSDEGRGDPGRDTPPFYRIAEVYFPSLEALQACASTITRSTVFDAGTIHN